MMILFIIIELYFLINGILYPFWNLILLLLFFLFSAEVSVIVLKFRYLVSFVLLCFFIASLLTSKLKENYVLMILVVYEISWIMINYFFDKNIKNILFVLYYFLIISILFWIPNLRLNFYRKNSSLIFNKLNKLIKIYLNVGLLVVVLGILERFLIPDKVLIDSSYYYFLGLAKGLSYHQVPDNLFTMFKHYYIRRMVSIVGEPLYFAYYIYPITFIFFVKALVKRSSLEKIKFLLSFIALLLSISKYIYGAFLVSAILFLIRHSKYREILILLAFLMILIMPSIVYILSNVDTSTQGHILSFIKGVKHIGYIGLIFPSFNTVLINSPLFPSRTVESSLLILISNMGVLGILLITFWIIYYINFSLKKERIYIRNIGDVGLFIVCFPYIFAGYLFTIIFSPHLLTFQMENYVLSLSNVYIIGKSLVKRY